MKKKKTRIYLIAAGVLVGCIGIAAIVFVLLKVLHIDEASLTGKYVGTYDVFSMTGDKYRNGIYQDGKHTLELRPDGTYVYTYTRTNGQELKIENNWELELSNWNAGGVVLSKFKLGSPDFNSDKPGFRHLHIEREIGRTRLVVSYDFSYYLVKY